MRKLIASLVLIAPLALAACATSQTQVSTTSPVPADMGLVDLGASTTGSPCSMRARGLGGEIYCSTRSERTSARLRAADAKTAGDLGTLVTSSTWRTELDKRLTCAAPQATTILGDVPAQVLNCGNRIYPVQMVAMVASANGTVWYADGLDTSRPAIEKAIGIMLGRAAPTAAKQDNAAAIAKSTEGDDLTVADLVEIATRANREGDPVASENAWRKIIVRLSTGASKAAPDDPALATTYMSLAVQLSNEHRFADADSEFARAEALVGRSADVNANARLKHYRAIHLLNQSKPDAALPLLDEAEALYLQRVGDLGEGDTAAVKQMQELVQVNGLRLRVADEAGGRQSCAVDPQRCSALAGIIEIRRNRSWAMRLLSRPAESVVAAGSAERFAIDSGMSQPKIISYVYRSEGLASAGTGNWKAADGHLGNADSAFIKALGDSIPGAQTKLRRGESRSALADPAGALQQCREAAQVLTRLKTGVDAEVLQPCLDLYGAQATDQQRLAEMFSMAQLRRSRVTSQDIQRATERLSLGGGNPLLSEAIRRFEDAKKRQQALLDQRSALDTTDGQQTTADRAASLDKELAATSQTISEAGDFIDNNSNYGQLVEQAVTAQDIFAALQPGEVFVSFSIGAKGGWVLALRDGKIAAARVEGGSARIDALVASFRKGVEAPPSSGDTFDSKAAYDLYVTTLGGVGSMLDGATSLVVAPTGSLLSVPFGALLTQPKGDLGYDKAPWLLRKFPVAHVPSAANLVSLRKFGDKQMAARTQNWVGFGDFRPPTLRQASQSFGPNCGSDATTLANLPLLPASVPELEEARSLTGGSARDVVRNADFTAEKVMKMQLANYRIVHFATHALLSTDLACQSEPALITSTPAGATDAKGAFLTASTVLSMKLNADAVILSACNTGGADGTSAGESLSGLARSFFYAGTRSLMITHWEANDNVVFAIVPDTLKRVVDGKGEGLPTALREQQLAYLENARINIAYKHPFFWAPFAIVGDNTLLHKNAQASRTTGTADAPG